MNELTNAWKEKDANVSHEVIAVFLLLHVYCLIKSAMSQHGAGCIYELVVRR